MVNNSNETNIVSSLIMVLLHFSKKEEIILLVVQAQVQSLVYSYSHAEMFNSMGPSHP